MITTIVELIPHEEQRYPTVGDYDTNTFGATHIRISRMGNFDYEFLVSIHEQIEAYLCKSRGISEQAITDFDVEYERNRKDDDLSEPGNDSTSPYYREHQFATKIEKLVAQELGVDWDEYDKDVNSM